MRQLLTGFLLQIQFFTRLPLPLNLKYNAEILARSFPLFPVVGMVIGGLIAGLLYLAGFISLPLITPLLPVIAGILISGGLHLDGFADTLDGLHSCRDRDKALEIMKDPRIGTFGVLGLILLILLKSAILFSLDKSSLIAVAAVMPVPARLCAVFSAAAAPYAREGNGMGKLFADLTGVKECIFASLPVIAYAALLLGWKAALPASLAIVYTLLFTTHLKKRLGGVTGDTMGYTIEITEVLFLLGILVQQEILNTL